jgi:hypothetical protein
MVLSTSTTVQSCQKPIEMAMLLMIWHFGLAGPKDHCSL